LEYAAGIFIKSQDVVELKQLIEKAIEYHGSIELPPDLDVPCLLFSQLIRDVDKIFGYVDFKIEHNGKQLIIRY
jgi:hypothetical protein